MRYWEIISEEGKIVKGVNTTPDVQPGEMARQGAKLGFTLTPDGLPPVWTGLASFTNAKDTVNSGDPFYDADGTNPKKSAPIIESLQLSPTGGTHEIKLGDTRIIYGISSDATSGEIISVRTPAAKRKAGSARAALTTFIQAADEAGIILKLGASPLDRKTHLGKLVHFYQSLGFELTGRKINSAGEPELVRHPKK